MKSISYYGFLMFFALVIFFTEKVPAQTADNLIVNGGFEKQVSGVECVRRGQEGPPENWISYYYEDSKAEWCGDAVHSGKKAVKLCFEQSAEPKHTICWRSTPIAVQARSEVKFSCWIKTKDVARGEKGWHRPNVKIIFLDETKKYLGFLSLFTVAESNSEWKYYEKKFFIPDVQQGKSVKFIQASLDLSYCRGTAWFDDVSIIIIQEPTALPSFLVAKNAGSLALERRHTPIIIPQPWKEKYGKESIEPSKIAILRPDKSKDESSVEKLSNYLKIKHGYAVREIGKIEEVGDNDTIIMLGGIKRNPYIEDYLKRLNIEINWKETGEQGYLLAIKKLDGKNIIILASDGEAGVYYGLESLMQWPEKAGQKNKFSDGVVIDRPAYCLRGLVMGVPSIGRLKLLSRYKRNMVLVFANKNWFAPLSIQDKAHMKNFFQECRKRYITPVILSHPGYYLKGQGAKLHFSDNKLISGMLKQFTDLYELGYRYFSIHFDDMGRYGGQDVLIYPDDVRRFKSVAHAHRYITELVYAHLKSLDPQNRLYALPMHYALSREPQEKEYLDEFSKLPEDIIFVSTGIKTLEDLNHQKQLTGRTAICWDNYFSRYDKFRPVPEIISPLELNVSSDLSNYVSCYMFPMGDKEMWWSMSSEYLWKGKDYNPELSARRAVIKMGGIDAYELLQAYNTYREKLQNSYLKGETKQERLNCLENQIKELDGFERQLETRLNNRSYISNEIRKEIESKKKWLSTVIQDYKQREFPVIIPFIPENARIDGRLNETVWKNAKHLSSFSLPLKGESEIRFPAAQTECFLYYNNKSLFLAFKCFEPRMSRVNATKKKRDATVYHDDCVEIFLDLKRNGNAYYQFAVNILGAVYDAVGYDKNWNGNCRFVVRKETDCWYMEAAIPFECLNIPRIKKGLRWNFNLCRERYAGQVPEFSSWALLHKRFHEPQRFWTLEFGQ
ncbi:MAG: carbohydrate-binding family 9-like protein [Victivallaceae bacterium]|nr:carbohydrate-binding family 9-like protein [Victivallaceae bacterium]